MSWRPKEWKNPLVVIEQSCVISDATPSQIFEAGADAMYEPAYNKGKEDGKKELMEALKKSEDYIESVFPDTETLVYGKWVKVKSRKGWLVFIPDESQNE